MHARLLREYSRRTTARLRVSLPLRLALPALEGFLRENVDKEIRKDIAVIRCAASAVACGSVPAPDAVQDLLDGARDVDREFLRHVRGFPIRLDIPYARIEPLRLQRIRVGLALASRILEGWRAGRRLRQMFAAGELERQLREMLRLYADEVLALADGVRLPAVVAPLREALGRRLTEAMDEAADSLLRAVPAATQNR